MLGLRKIIHMMLVKCGNLYSYYNDERLIRIYIQQKDQCAYEEIANRYLDRIFSLVYRIIKDINITEDVVQEIYITLSEKIGTFKGNSSFSTWIYRVSMNAALMKLRKEKKYRNDYSLVDELDYEDEQFKLGTYQVSDSENRPDVLNYKKESYRILEDSISSLPKNYSLIIHLKDIEGLSIKEISEILEITPQAVKSRIHRARLKLKELLENNLSDWRD